MVTVAVTSTGRLAGHGGFLFGRSMLFSMGTIRGYFISWGMGDLLSGAYYIIHLMVIGGALYRFAEMVIWADLPGPTLYSTGQQSS